MVDDMVRANLERDPDYKNWAKRMNAAQDFEKSLGNLNESLPDKFLGMPLETFSDYYHALGVALELGLTAAVVAAVLGTLGIRKGIELFEKGKEAVMAWYERNKLNEQEDVQSKTKINESLLRMQKLAGLIKE